MTRCVAGRDPAGAKQAQGLTAVVLAAAEAAAAGDLPAAEAAADAAHLRGETAFVRRCDTGFHLLVPISYD